MFQMVDTPLQPHPLTCPSSEATEKESAVNTSCFPTDSHGRSCSHPPLSLSLSSPLTPLSSRYAFTSLTPSFSSQFSPSLVGWSFQPPLQQKEQRRQGHFPCFAPLQGEGERGCKTSRPPPSSKAAKTKQSKKSVQAKFLNQPVQK